MAACLVDVDVFRLDTSTTERLPVEALGLRFRASSLPADDVVLRAPRAEQAGDRDATEADRASRPLAARAPAGRAELRIVRAAMPRGRGRRTDRRVGPAAASASAVPGCGRSTTNFIQASKGGTAADVRAVMEAVRARVADATGYHLRSEVHLVGFTERARARCRSRIRRSNCVVRGIRSTSAATHRGAGGVSKFKPRPHARPEQRSTSSHGRSGSTTRPTPPPPRRRHPAGARRRPAGGSASADAADADEPAGGDVPDGTDLPPTGLIELVIAEKPMEPPEPTPDTLAQPARPRIIQIDDITGWMRRCHQRPPAHRPRRRRACCSHPLRADAGDSGADGASAPAVITMTPTTCPMPSTSRAASTAGCPLDRLHRRRPRATSCSRRSTATSGGASSRACVGGMCRSAGPRAASV